MRSLGLYIHIPFCKSKCRYCDFCSFPHREREKIDEYVFALIKEINEKKEEYSSFSVDTVYFGGGTPTLLPISSWEAIMTAVRSSFNVTVDAEISAECNPATADEEYLKKLFSLGVNRLSIGAQSADDGELLVLGRLHKHSDTKATVNAALKAGFTNVSVDVMYGIPNGTRESLDSTIRELCSLGVTHLSLYGLKIEEGTYFHKHKNELSLPDEDTEYEMYIESTALLRSLGFSKYEISNFARDGFYSRHNLKYWLRKDYLGLGLSAHSCIGSKRSFNTSDIDEYLSGNVLKKVEEIPPHDVLCERIMLGMRLTEGCNFKELEKEFGSDTVKYRNTLLKFIPSGHVKENEDVLSFSDSGMYISNYILSETLDFFS